MVQIHATGSWNNVKNCVSDEMTQIMVQIVAISKNVTNSGSDCCGGKIGIMSQILVQIATVLKKKLHILEMVSQIMVPIATTVKKLE